MVRPPRRSDRLRLSRHARTNRAAWDEMADWFERTHDRVLSRSGGQTWGIATERNLRLLGNVRGRDILELGCGAGRWAVSLARSGAHVVALDLSPRRIGQARERIERAGVKVRLLEASAEHVPLPDDSFDVIFCDVGAMTFADPYKTVPEAARLLRPGGQLTFSTSSPFRMVFWNERTDRLDHRPRRDYFRMHRVRLGKTFEFQLPYGEWVRLFRDHGFVIERLIEPRLSPHVRSSFLTLSEARWARKWPYETIWSVRKATSGRGAAPTARPRGRSRPGRLRAAPRASRRR